MASREHLKNLVLVGTKGTQAGDGTHKAVNNGFLIDSTGGNNVFTNRTRTVDLINTAANISLGVGVFGFFDPVSFKNVQVGDSQATTGQSLILAATSPYSIDAITPNIGGLQQSRKSKLINPKKIKQIYRTDYCQGNQAVLNIGTTPYTLSNSPVESGCAFTFACGQTYFLRIDVKGSPAMRTFGRDIYRQIEAYTGCCPASPTTQNVDPTWVMIQWANTIIADPMLQNFVLPVVYGQDGNVYYAPGTVGAAHTWDTYVVQTWTAGMNAGLILYGSYVDTVFGTCSFLPSDFFEKMPVQLYAQLVDNIGQPCSFTGICNYLECCPKQGEGFGDTILKALILSEKYLTGTPFEDDVRMREIEGNNDLFTAINKANLYTTYHLFYIDEQYANPNVDTNSPYLEIEIVTNGPSTLFESFLTTWMAACGCNVAPVWQVDGHATCFCTPIVPPLALPAGGGSSVSPILHE